MTEHTELEVLIQCYTEEHRFYHTLEHIGFMFKHAKVMGVGLTKDQQQAIWWHDAVYKPLSDENEIQSRWLMRTYSKPSMIAERIILDTANHYPTIEESATVIDLDLAILARPRYSDYERYVKQVMQEYTYGGKISMSEFDKGRRRWIFSKLSLPRIFHTERFSVHEGMARKNLERELKNYE